MEDNKSKVAGHDYRLVSTKEAWEVEFWTKQFGCSETDLHAAIHAVGHTAGRVKRHIRLRHSMASSVDQRRVERQQTDRP